MTEPPQGPSPDGPRAQQAVADDPFWSVVRRRHPDVDIVLLPATDGGRVETPPGTPVEEPDEAAAREDAAVRRAWVRLVGDLGPVEATWRARWVPGGAPDRVRREATLTAEPVAVEEVGDRLPAAAARLREDGWHVLTPPDGVPRVLAGLDGELGRTELQLVLAPEAGRLVLRVRSADHVVGEAAASELVAP